MGKARERVRVSAGHRLGLVSHQDCQSVRIYTSEQCPRQDSNLRSRLRRGMLYDVSTWQNAPFPADWGAYGERPGHEPCCTWWSHTLGRQCRWGAHRGHHRGRVECSYWVLWTVSRATMPTGWPRPQKRWRLAAGRSLSRVPVTSLSCWCLPRSGSGCRIWSRRNQRRGGAGVRPSVLPRRRMAQAWMRPLSAAALRTCSTTRAPRDRPGRPGVARCACPAAATARPGS